MWGPEKQGKQLGFIVPERDPGAQNEGSGHENWAGMQVGPETLKGEAEGIGDSLKRMGLGRESR